MSLPPIGSRVKLAGPSTSLVPLHPEWAGTVVKIYAHFETDRGNKLAAYVSDDHMVGGIGIEAMFVPCRTPEQIAEEEREKDCLAMLDIIKKSPWGMAAGPHEVIALLRDAGYRKQPKE